MGESFEQVLNLLKESHSLVHDNVVLAPQGYEGIRTSFAITILDPANFLFIPLAENNLLGTYYLTRGVALPDNYCVSMWIVMPNSQNAIPVIAAAYNSSGGVLSYPEEHRIMTIRGGGFNSDSFLRIRDF